MAKILLAEDDDSMRHFPGRALERAGHEVFSVSQGDEALPVLAEGRFDLLLADIVMPQLDGIALALKVSRDHPDMPILLMTGYAAERQRAHNLDALIHDVITKPFTLREICDTVQRAIDGNVR